MLSGGLSFGVLVVNTKCVLSGVLLSKEEVLLFPLLLISSLPVVAPGREQLLSTGSLFLGLGLRYRPPAAPLADLG